MSKRTSVYRWALCLAGCVALTGCGGEKDYSYLIDEETSGVSSDDASYDSDIQALEAELLKGAGVVAVQGGGFAGTTGDFVAVAGTTGAVPTFGFAAAGATGDVPTFGFAAA
ncbi:MAG: hypothetical protein IKU86_09715, partial [Thermoguttaceae bacterium]|nr:hypothetical protein [Thermoguttaceae bacterium]